VINEKALGPDHASVARTLNNLGALYQAQGRYAQAEPLYKRSLAIKEKALGPDHPDVALSLNNLAELYRAQGSYAEAEPAYKRSLVIWEKSVGPDHPHVAAFLNNLASLYVAQGRYTDAEPRYLRSLAIWEKSLGSDHPNVAFSLNNLGLLYQAQGRYAEAEQFYERSLAIREMALGADHPDVAASLNNLAELYRDQGRYADAEPLYKRSLLIKEKAFGPDHPDVALSLNNLGLLYQNQGRYAVAEPLLKRSLAIKEKAFGPDHPDVAAALNNLAELYRAQGRYAEAEPLYKRSLVINEKALGPDHASVARTLNNLATLYGNQGRFSDAMPIVQRTISQNSANKSVAFAVLYGSHSQNLISPTQALNASYTVLQRSVSSAAGEAVSKLAARFAVGNNELAQLVRKDQDLTAESDRLDESIIAAVSKPPAQRNASAEDQIRKRIDQIKSERDKLQDVFNEGFPNYVALSKPQPLTIEQTQALLADDEALVTIDLDKKSYVWVITTDRAEWKELTINAEDVSKSVETLRTGLNPNSPKPFDRNLAYQLYRQVLGPVEDIISQKTRLSFVLDQALTSLPPQVLIISDPNGKDFASLDWLIRKYAVTVLPSIASLKILREEKSTVAAINPMIGFGDPVFDRTTPTPGRQHVSALSRSLTSFYRGVTADTKALAQALPALPETADELQAVAKILGAKSEDIKLGEAASVTTVKKEALANYRVVYFATHALVAGQVGKFAKVKAEPALVLSIPVTPSEEDDGLLTASEVAMLKLNADFVVLSACNTAAGDKPGAEALSGLARAFFYAGAKSLVVSHWEVDSEATVALMDGLFEALNANPHLSHAEALRDINVADDRQFVGTRIGSTEVLGTFRRRWRAAKEVTTLAATPQSDREGPDRTTPASGGLKLQSAPSLAPQAEREANERDREDRRGLDASGKITRHFRHATDPTALADRDLQDR
jgi:CHAT domain-containing protein/tetratricopeptide (TPR) repeat protein